MKDDGGEIYQEDLDHPLYSVVTPFTFCFNHGPKSNKVLHAQIKAKKTPPIT
jgi:hypothetical protein